MKPALRTSLKLAALAGGAFSPGRPAGVALLIYHQVGGRLPLDIDLPLPLLRRQLQYLAGTGRVISYEQALTCLHKGSPLPGDRYVLTFDDGYREFYTEVFPLLQEFALPAVLFVTTGFVEEGYLYPLSRDGLAAQPVTWDMLGRLHQSGLVTVGAHTHTHPNLVDEPAPRIRAEIERSQELFRTHLGFEPVHFAYPRALWNEPAEQVIRQYYRSAVVGTGRKALVADFHPYRIPRVPVRASDGWFFFRAKLRGWLEAEERLYLFLHRRTTNKQLQR